jgi:hypothetical protein
MGRALYIRPGFSVKENKEVYLKDKNISPTF